MPIIKIKGSGGGGGGGGITSINSDTTAAQTIAVGSTGTNFAIVNGGSGLHTLNLPVASGTNTGKLSNTDWTTFNNKQAALTLGNLTSPTTGVTIGSGTGAVVGSGTTVAVQTATGAQPGLLSAADWTTFNAKQAALTIGNLTDAGTDGIIVTSGTGAVIGSGTSLAQHVSDSTHNGYLSSTDWTTFTGKQAAGNYITALTGDVAAAGPGSVASTIANSAVTNAKVSASAAIDFSKLAALTSAHILVGSAGNVATDVAVSGDLTATNAGAFTVAKIQTTTVSGTTGSGNVVFSASPTHTGTAVFASASVSGSLVKGNYHLEPGITANGNSSTAITLDFSASNFHTVTMTANCTFTFSSPQTGGLYIVQLLEDGTGNWVSTWPATVKWFGSAITQLSPANKLDMFTFVWDGTNYWATAAMNGG